MRLDEKMKSKFKGIAKETLEICKQGSYQTNAGQRINISNDIQHMVDGTYVFESDINLTPQDIIPYYSKDYLVRDKVVVTQRTTNDSIKHWGYEGRHVVALNFASAKSPGGRVFNGDNAQEEAIARTSTLYASLESKLKEYYVKNRNNLNRGVYHDTGIYSPNVQFIRDNNEEGEPLITPHVADIITCAAVNRRGALRNKVRDEEINLAMVNRINTIFSVFLDEVKKNNWGSMALVLGAFGCGVFMNNPESVSMIFKSILNKYEKELLELDIVIDFPIPYGKNFTTFKLEL